MRDVVFDFDRDGLAAKMYCKPSQEKCETCTNEYLYGCWNERRTGFKIRAVYLGGAMVLDIDEDSEVLLSSAVLEAAINDKLDEPEKPTLERWLWKYRIALDQLRECKEDFGKRYLTVFLKRCRELGLVSQKKS